MEGSKGRIRVGGGEGVWVLREEEFKFDGERVVDRVVMGERMVWEMMKEGEGVYGKEDFRDEEGMKGGEVEEKFGELEGWNGERDGGMVVRGVGIKEEKE